MFDCSCDLAQGAPVNHEPQPGRQNPVARSRRLRNSCSLVFDDRPRRGDSLRQCTGRALADIVPTAAHAELQALIQRARAQPGEIERVRSNFLHHQSGTAALAASMWTLPDTEVIHLLGGDVAGAPCAESERRQFEENLLARRAGHAHVRRHGV